MKILSFDEFTQLPAGTIFSYYKPHSCDDLFQKGETLFGREGGRASSYYEASLLPYLDFEHDPPVIVMDGAETRWGFYDYEQQYAVYEREDLERLATMIAEALQLTIGGE